MIVKNERPVIARCLASVRPLIDTWVIVDTGSTDGTQDHIREVLAELPGELHERPWVDFAHNRSEALKLARGKADYVLIIDADEILEFEPDFVLPSLSADCYHFAIISGDYAYFKAQLVRDALPWRYEGVLHEYICCDQATREAELPGVRTLRFPDGARARNPQTYQRDALILESALIDDPDNRRYVFYLAQSYRDAGEPELALRHYQRRVELGGWEEEVWYSMYQIGCLQAASKRPWDEVMASMLAAFEFKPTRAEPLARCAFHYLKERSFHLAHLFLRQAVTLPYPSGDRLFVERSLYDYRLQLEYGVVAYYVQDHAAAIAANNALLCSPTLPAALVDKVRDNRRYSLDARTPRRRKPQHTGRIVVCVVVEEAGPALDDCVESLLQQTEQAVVIYVDNGTGGGCLEQLPEGEAPFHLLQTNERLPLAELVARCVAEHCSADDLILPMFACDYLAHRDALAEIRSEFAEHDVVLLFGQHRYRSGHVGLALPLPGQRELDALSDTWACFAPVVFRASLLRQLLDSSGRLALPPHVPELGEVVLHRALLRAAGITGAVFHDEPLLVVADHGGPPRPHQLTDEQAAALVARGSGF
jgi:glycosyltransferase involved in cell wall biosynthesis